MSGTSSAGPGDPARRRLTVRARRASCADGAKRRREVDAAAPRGRPDEPDPRRVQRAGPGRAAAPDPRRLPRPRHGRGRGTGRVRAGRSVWTLRSWQAAIRGSSPAGSASAWRWRSCSATRTGAGGARPRRAHPGHGPARPRWPLAALLRRTERGGDRRHARPRVRGAVRRSRRAARRRWPDRRRAGGEILGGGTYFATETGADRARRAGARGRRAGRTQSGAGALVSWQLASFAVLALGAGGPVGLV